MTRSDVLDRDPRELAEAVWVLLTRAGLADVDPTFGEGLDELASMMDDALGSEGTDREALQELCALALRARARARRGGLSRCRHGEPWAATCAGCDEDEAREERAFGPYGR